MPALHMSRCGVKDTSAVSDGDGRKRNCKYKGTSVGRERWICDLLTYKRRSRTLSGVGPTPELIPGVAVKGAQSGSGETCILTVQSRLGGETGRMLPRGRSPNYLKHTSIQ